MRAKRVVRAPLTKTELQAIADYTQKLIDQEMCDPQLLDVNKVGVQTLLDTTSQKLADRPEVVNGVAYFYMNGSLWKHDLSDVWHARRMKPLEEGRVYAASPLYAQNGQARIDIIRLGA